MTPVGPVADILEQGSPGTYYLSVDFKVAEPELTIGEFAIGQIALPGEIEDPPS